MLINYIMGEKAAHADPESLKWMYSLYSAIIFFVIANPFTYKIVQSILGRFVKIANGGCATQVGVFVHSIVFMLIVRYLM